MMKKILTANWNLINDNIFYYEKERRKVKITLKEEKDIYIEKLNKKYKDEMIKKCEEHKHLKCKNDCSSCHNCNNRWYWEKFANENEKNDYYKFQKDQNEKLDCLNIIKSEFTILQLKNESEIFLANYILECMFFKVIGSEIKNESFKENHIEKIIPVGMQFTDKNNELAKKILFLI